MCLLTSGFPAGKPARLQDVEASLQHGHRLTQTLSHSPLLVCNSNQMCPDVLGCMESFLPVWLEHKCLNSEADLRKKKEEEERKKRKANRGKIAFLFSLNSVAFPKVSRAWAVPDTVAPHQPPQGRISPCCSENEEKSRKKKKQQKTENRQLAHVLVFTIETTQL